MNKYMMTLLTLPLLTSCNNGSLLNTNADESGATGTVTINETHSGASSTFTTDLGYTVTLTTATLNWKRVSLLPEGDDPSCTDGPTLLLPLNYNGNLLDEDGTQSSMTESTITQRSYCQYQVVLGPLDAPTTLVFKAHAGHDHGPAPIVPDESVQENADSTLYLAGTWSQGGAPTAFAYSISDEITVNGTFQADEDGTIVNHPLHFHTGTTVATATFSILTDQLLNGIAFASNPADEVVDDHLAENLRDAFHQSTH